MKYLIIAAIIVLAYTDHVVSPSTPVGPPHHVGHVGGLTDWNHDGIPDQYEGYGHGWGNSGWGNHWGGVGNWGHHLGGLTDWNHDGIPDQYEGWNNGWGNNGWGNNGWGNHWGNGWGNEWNHWGNGLNNWW